MNYLYILSELDRLKSNLSEEYSNSHIDFDCYFEELKKVLLEEKIRCLFVWKNGKKECRHLTNSEIMPVYSLAMSSISNIVSICNCDTIPNTKDIQKVDFRLQIIDNFIIYIEQ
jgi:hypothetical protein